MARVLVQPLFVVPQHVWPNGRISYAMTFCAVCGRTGLPGGRWQEPCLQNPEHPHRCSCGMRYPSRAAIAAHIRAEQRWRPKAVHNQL